jgi:fructan beta-fructosidase
VTTTDSFPYAETDYQEPHRGQFHFSPRNGWMNDPNGLVHYRGTYHLYFQHNPYGLAWDTMHWGHATSTDLVHWQQQPIALDPKIHPGELWSGGGVVDVDNTSGLRSGSEDPIVVFSGTQGVRMFYSLDGGTTFSAYAGGAIVAQPSGTESRDPKVIWHPPTERWAMVVWSDNGGNGVDFFVSANLREWERTSRYQAEWFFECPDFTPMLLHGEIHYVLRDAAGRYVVGDFDGERFTTSWTEPRTITVNPGAAAGDYYAAQSFQNMPNDRVVTIAWQGRNHGSSWTGNASIAVEQQLVNTPDGPRIASEPVDEIRSLRRSTSTWGPESWSAEGPRLLVEGDTYAVEAAVDLTRTHATSITFRLAGRDVTYDVGARQLDGHDLVVDGELSVRLLVDRGQLDIFATGGSFYQAVNVDFDGGGFWLVADGPVMLTSLAVHELGSIWG